jgi:hypothetical protein
MEGAHSCGFVELITQSRVVKLPLAVVCFRLHSLIHPLRPSSKMMFFHIILLIWNFVFLSTQAQQFSDLPLNASWPGVSNSCFQALNTTVSCPGIPGTWLYWVCCFSFTFLDPNVCLNPATKFRSNPRMSPEKLTALCVPACLASLNSVRQTIQRACTLSADIINSDGITYPGMSNAFYSTLKCGMAASYFETSVFCREYSSYF